MNVSREKRWWTAVFESSTGGPSRKILRETSSSAVNSDLIAFASVHRWALDRVVEVGPTAPIIALFAKQKNESQVA